MPSHIRVSTVSKASGTPLTSPAAATRALTARQQWSSTSPSRPHSRAPLTPAVSQSDFGIDVAGKIVLLQRGTCDFGLKAQNASQAGAVGAVIFNEGTIGAPDRNDVLIPTLAGYDVTIPVVGTDYATGRSLVDLANDGGVTLRVQVDGIVNEDVPTNNVIAETPGGRADRTVVVGGHLDSVPQGPGINDDGSGVSTMLETAEQMDELGITPRNKVRFIFFSGEEQGLLGSDYYVSQLNKKQIQDISVMLDFDMLASPNYARFIYDGNGDEHGFAGPNGSGTVEQVFKDFWDSQELGVRDHPVRRPVRLRRLHGCRDPGGRHLRRRRSHQAALPGPAIRRHRWRPVRRVLPPALRPPDQHQ